MTDGRPSPPTLSARDHYGFLDGLRGLAVLFVLFSHASGYGIHIIPGFDAGGAGKTGVWLFFVLSAFLLTGRLDSLASRGQLDLRSIAAYLIGRVMRIYPLFIPALLPWLWQGTLDWAAVGRHILLLDGIYWVIPVEFKFYFLIPVIVVVFHLLFKERLASFALCSAGLAVVLNLYYPPSLALKNSIFLSPYIMVFLAGSLGALAVARGVSFRWMRGVTPLLLFLFAIATIPSVASLLLGQHVRPGFLHSYCWLFGITWMIALASCFENRFLNRLLSCRPLGFIGKISFSLYLLHGWTLAWVRGLDGAPDSVKAASFVLASCALATITYYLIEVPGMRAGRRMAAWVMARGAAGTP